MTDKDDEMITLHDQKATEKEASEQPSVTVRDKSQADVLDNPLDKVAYEKEDNEVS